ncbi:hypothetical protein BBJ28_00023175 [Nothophytophthora sp. Chile5]|nr:hypothetical protein BBJ28_00023175 [Nothophytophthora sp. Chile5]
MALREVAGECVSRQVRQTHWQLQCVIQEAAKRNTELLAQLAALTDRQAELACMLNRKQDGALLLLEDDASLAKRETMERDKIARLVEFQVRDVEAVKQVIGLLCVNDGKINAPRGWDVRVEVEVEQHNSFSR